MRSMLQKDRFLSRGSKRSEFFVTKVESVSSNSVDMLDIVIYKGPRHTAIGKIDVGMFVKATHQGTSLCHLSGHHPSIHIAWPSARLAYSKRICTSRPELRKAQCIFLSKLARDCPEHPMLGLLINRIRRQTHSTVSESRPSTFCSSWLVLPYHPCWRNAKIAWAINACVSFFVDPDINCYHPRISWANGGQHLWRTFSS